MKVLLIKPMEHPQVVDIEDSLDEFYRILECDCITAMICSRSGRTMIIRTKSWQVSRTSTNGEFAIYRIISTL